MNHQLNAIVLCAFITMLLQALRTWRTTYRRQFVAMCVLYVLYNDAGAQDL
jgi:hypothetical protein